MQQGEKESLKRKMQIVYQVNFHCHLGHVPLADDAAQPVIFQLTHIFANESACTDRWYA